MTVPAFLWSYAWRCDYIICCNQIVFFSECNASYLKFTCIIFYIVHTIIANNKEKQLLHIFKFSRFTISYFF